MVLIVHHKINSLKITVNGPLDMGKAHRVLQMVHTINEEKIFKTTK
jgi:hypothetical protein